jgi:outer membrane immunogenic protein
VAAPGLALRVERNWQGSLRGRIGYGLDNILVYATAGVSLTEFEHSYQSPVTLLPEAGSASKAGYTIGGGVNYGLTDSLILGLDYRYTSYGKFAQADRSAVPGLAIEQSATMHTLRASIAYKF